MKPVQINKNVEKGVVDSDKKPNFVRRNISLDVKTDKDLNRVCLSIVDEGDKPEDRSAYIRALIRYALSLSVRERLDLYNQFKDS